MIERQANVAPGLRNILIGRRACLRPALGLCGEDLRPLSGPDERGVDYVKKNTIAGRSFDSFAALEAHLAA
jgi:hypothetical protein